MDVRLSEKDQLTIRRALEDIQRRFVEASQERILMGASREDISMDEAWNDYLTSLIDIVSSGRIVIAGETKRAAA